MDQSVDALYKPLEKLDAIALQFLCIRLDIFLPSLLYLTRILLSMSIY